MLFSIENELMHLESLAKLMQDEEKRSLLLSSTNRIRGILQMLLENSAACEAEGMTQTQREVRVAEYDKDIPSVTQAAYIEIGHGD